MNRLHTAGIVAALLSVIGALAEPGVLHLLPASYATPILILGVVLQALTKPVNAGNTVLTQRHAPVDALILPPPES